MLGLVTDALIRYTRYTLVLEGIQPYSKKILTATFRSSTTPLRFCRLFFASGIHRIYSLANLASKPRLCRA